MKYIQKYVLKITASDELFGTVCFPVEVDKQVGEDKSIHYKRVDGNFWVVTVKYQHLGQMKEQYHELRL